MASRLDAADAMVAAVPSVAFAAAAALMVAASGAPPWGIAAGATLLGLGTCRLVLVLRVRNKRRWLDAAQRQAGFTMRELVRLIVPRAAAQATTRTGGVDPERFRDLVVASIAKATGQTASNDGHDLGPAVWEAEGEEPRTAAESRRLEALLAYPDVAEARGLLRSLEGLGPQTIHQFVEYARNARDRLAVGLEPMLVGLPDAVLTGHLIAAGLVQEVEGPDPGALQEQPGARFYALTPRGHEVARLFTPRTARPQALAALDSRAGGCEH